MSTEAEIYEIGVEAYVYFYSLVTMDVTRRVTTNIEAGKRPGFGPMNAFSHLRAFPPADFNAVVRPNFDTLYSSAWLDLTQEPVIVSAPDTNGRYYMLPMLDMWTDVFAVPGKRTTGTKEGHFAVVPLGWRAALPKGVECIEAPTRYVWIIGRTQTNGPSDYAAVSKVQDGYKITPFSQWDRPPKPITVKINPTVDMKTPPLDQVNKMPAGKYFSYASELLKVNPPHISDQPIIARMKRIGIEVCKSFDYEKSSPEVKSALEQAAQDGLERMYEKIPTVSLVVNGWQMNTDTMGVYGNYYLKRAIVAMVDWARIFRKMRFTRSTLATAPGTRSTEQRIMCCILQKTSCRPWMRSGRSPCTTKMASRLPISSIALLLAIATRWSTTLTARSTCTSSMKARAQKTCVQTTISSIYRACALLLHPASHLNRLPWSSRGFLRHGKADWLLDPELKQRFTGYRYLLRWCGSGSRSPEGTAGSRADRRAFATSSYSANQRTESGTTNSFLGCLSALAL